MLAKQDRKLLECSKHSSAGMFWVNPGYSRRWLLAAVPVLVEPSGVWRLRAGVEGWRLAERLGCGRLGGRWMGSVQTRVRNEEWDQGREVFRHRPCPFHLSSLPSLAHHPSHGILRTWRLLAMAHHISTLTDSARSLPGEMHLQQPVLDTASRLPAQDFFLSLCQAVAAECCCKGMNLPTLLTFVVP